MNNTSRRLDLEIRPYRNEDEPRVLELLNLALGSGPVGVRSSEFFRWKHMANPFGESFMLVADHNGRIIGLRAFMRWRFDALGAEIRGVSAVDTATHPEYQGRGVFSSLTRAALEQLRGDADLVFNTPNAKSLPGYLKMGWRRVGQVPVLLRVRRPMAFVMGGRSRHRGAPGAHASLKIPALPAAELIREEQGAIGELLADCGEGDGRLRTRRGLAYLQWRYGDAPLLDYRAVTEQRDGRVRGVAFFRVRQRGRLWEAAVAELIVTAGDLATARGLLQRIRRSVSVDHLTCLFPIGSVQKRAAIRSGFVRTPGGITLVAKPLREGLRPDPTRPESWALTLGDLEVF